MEKNRVSKKKKCLIPLLSIFCLISFGVHFLAFAQTGSQAQKKTRVVLLGTGTPNADSDRSGPAVAIVVNNTPYLVDFGPGVVRRASAAFAANFKGLSVIDLKCIFVTHLHSDHTAGYPDLIFTPWVLGRSKPLEVYGPKGIRDMTEHILAAYEQDINIRVNGMEAIHNEGYKVKAHEIEPGLVYEDGNVIVEAFRVKHGTWPLALGYKFKTRDRTIVISGDTCPTESVVEQCAGCDVLIHEVYSAAGAKRRSPFWQQYHKGSHTSSYELAEIASRAKPKLLILYHQLFWGVSEEELVLEIKQRYDGEVSSGKDLEVY
jgi:ribonuclease BN (tRNA processing enzyme)